MSDFPSVPATSPPAREPGTGTGVATAGLRDGMTPAATPDTADVEPAPVDVARRHLGRGRFPVGLDANP
jgi:hypothetical protein